MTDDKDAVQPVTAALFHDWRLPLPNAQGDKEDRGHVFVIAGSGEMPGAAILSAEAALRAGAGKLTIVTAASIAPGVALAVPEAKVVGLRETLSGGLDPQDAGRITPSMATACALLIGPGMQDESATRELVRALVAACPVDVPIVLDALAMCAVHDMTSRGQTALTPHAGEMAGLTGLDKADVSGDAATHARQAAKAWNAIVVLKGRSTVIATPAGPAWCHDGGNVGLATSGSGDTLAGIIVGLAARGAPLDQACVLGVALHARAGVELARTRGPLGYLAREIAPEIPRLMHELPVA